MSPTVFPAETARRRARTCLHSRSGFTLTELLVVIAILAILAGLILPAVNAARETARRTECANKMHQLALHIEAFENANNRFPGWIEYPVKAIDVDSGNRFPWRTGWIPQMLTYMGRQDLVAENAGSLNWSRVDLTPPPVLPVGDAAVSLNDQLCCPSDAFKINHEVASGEEPLTSYVINCGRGDGVARVELPADWRSNAVFLNMEPAFPGAYVERQTKANITKNDGLNTTLLLSESLDPAVTWSQLLPSGPVETTTGFIFRDVPFPTSVFGLPAHPSSNHIGGVNVVFAGGNLSFMSTKVSYQIYAWMMTPNGALAKEPGSTSASDPMIVNQVKLTEDMWK
ncbi:MAG: DUF1559 domain-containing protein [Pirellulales bacterium]|nr:DUF1559 domain-containing protein [Pirellulales bacterium]